MRSGRSGGCALKAVKNVNEIIGPKLVGMDVREQKKIDEAMVQELDGSKNEWGPTAPILQIEQEAVFFDKFLTVVCLNSETLLRNPRGWSKSKLGHGLCAFQNLGGGVPGSPPPQSCSQSLVT